MHGFTDAFVQVVRCGVCLTCLHCGVGPKPTEKSYQLAEKIQRATIAVTGYRNRGIKDERRLAVLNPANHAEKTARCLVEISFLTEPGRSNAESEERRLRDER